jgi:AraC-like DNA-binding protein
MKSEPNYNPQGAKTLQGTFFNHPSNVAKELYHYPLWGAQFEVSYPYRTDRQYMNSFIIFWIQSGELNFTFDDRPNLLAKRDTVVLLDCKKPNHYYVSKTCRFIFFHFNGQPVQPLYDYITRNKQNSFECTPTLKQLFEQLLALLAEEAYTGNDLRYSQSLYGMLLNLTDSRVSQLDHATLHQTPKLVTDALAYIDLHYQEHITIKTLCLALNVSATLLSNKFKTYTNNSVHQYLISVRLSHAQQLLTGPAELSIAEIATTCGFHDASHLNKIFDQELDMTPSEFRKAYF